MDSKNTTRVSRFDGKSPATSQVVAAEVAAGVSPSIAHTLVTVVQRLRRAVLLLDDQQRILFANAAGRRLLDEGDALREEGGRLRLCAPKRAERLAAHFARSDAGPAVGSAGGLVLKLERSSGAPPYRVILTTLDAGDCPLEARCHLMIVHDPHAERAVETEVLQGVYGLTPAEAAVTARLFAGEGVGDAAVALGVSPRTVRAHLRSIFRKCEVVTQAQLLQLLALGPRYL